MLGCAACCKLIGADVATVGATGANTDIDGADDAYTVGATVEDNTAGCVNMVVGITMAPSRSPGTWSTISRGFASSFHTAIAS